MAKKKKRSGSDRKKKGPATSPADVAAPQRSSKHAGRPQARERPGSTGSERRVAPEAGTDKSGRSKKKKKKHTADESADAVAATSSSKGAERHDKKHKKHKKDKKQRPGSMESERTGASESGAGKSGKVKLKEHTAEASAGAAAALPSSKHVGRPDEKHKKHKANKKHKKHKDDKKHTKDTKKGFCPKGSERTGAPESGAAHSGRSTKERQGGTDGEAEAPDLPEPRATSGSRAVEVLEVVEVVEVVEVTVEASTVATTTPLPVPSVPTEPAAAPAPLPVPSSTPGSLGDVAGFLASLEAIADPERRYEVATAALGEHVKVIELLSAVRADAVAAIYASGGSVRSLAQRLGVSPSRVHQLIQEAQTRGLLDGATAGPGDDGPGTPG